MLAGSSTQSLCWCCAVKIKKIALDPSPSAQKVNYYVPKDSAGSHKARFVVADSRLRLQFSASLFIRDTAFSL